MLTPIKCANSDCESFVRIARMPGAPITTRREGLFSPLNIDPASRTLFTSCSYIAGFIAQLLFDKFAEL
ncbi:MAG: hypothetical protein JO307_24590 [Bryobacterales bacterium]|nr:hypothetical protein [Bryobacterales bacterium]